MGAYDTHGYDAVMELGESEIDNVIGCRFATGNLALPRGGSFSLEAVDVRTDMLFDTPWVRMVTNAGAGENEPGIRLVAPFDEAYAAASVSLPNIDANIEKQFVDLRGEIHLTLPLRSQRQGNTSTVVLVTEADTVSIDVQFASDTEKKLDEEGDRLAAAYEIVVDDPDQERIELLKNLPQTIRNQVSKFLKSGDAGELPTINLDVSIECKQLDLRVIDGPSSRTRCLLVMVQLADKTEGAPDAQQYAFDDCQRPQGTSASLALSSEYILSKILCPRLADSLGIANPESAFDYPCNLSEPTTTRLPVRGQAKDVTIHDLRAFVDSEQVVVEGRVSTTIMMARVTIWFTTRIDVNYENGTLTLSVADVETSSQIDDLPWFVDVFASIMPAITVLAVAIAQEFIDNKVSGAFSEEIRSREALTDAERANALLDEHLGRMSVETFSFDEDAMVLAGSLLPGQHCEAAASGTVFLPAGGQIDLDRGESTLGNSYIAEDAVDLGWRIVYGATELRPRNGAKTGIIGTANWTGPGSVLWLEAKDDNWWTRTPIESGAIPHGRLWLLYGRLWLLFGVYTSEGRYAKCGTRLRANGQLELRYYTFDRPTPSARLGCIREVLDEDKVGSGTDSWGDVNCYAVPSGTGVPSSIGGGGFTGQTLPGGLEIEQRQYDYELYKRAFRIMCKASTKLLAKPLDYTWRLNGQEIEWGSTVTIDDHEISCDITENECILTTTKGKALNATLIVDITDYRGLTFRATHDFDIPATIKEGGAPQHQIEQQQREIARCMAAEGGNQEPWPDGILDPDQVGDPERPDLPDTCPKQPRPDPSRNLEEQDTLREALGGGGSKRRREMEIRDALAEGLGLDAEKLDQFERDRSR
jgi:hypothetical protein